MASHSIGNRSLTSDIHLPFLIALLGPALLVSAPSSAQQPAPEAAPPAITADTFKADTPGHSTGHSKPITVPLGQEQSILPPRTPRYFQKIFHQFLQAPLPAEIFQQGGVPQSSRNMRLILTPAAELPRTNRSARRRPQATLSFRAWAITAAPASPAICRRTR